MFDKLKKMSGMFEEEENKTTTPATQIFAAAPTIPATNLQNSIQPAFVVQSSLANQSAAVNEEYLKFLENEMSKAKKQDMDYYDFRSLLSKTQAKMAAKGVTSTDVILQAVFITFEAQGITAPQLIQSANSYRELIKSKTKEFIQSGEQEKAQQLQQRESASQESVTKIQQLQSQIQDLHQKIQLLSEQLQKEQTQIELNKNLGQEAIDKIERASNAMKIAEEYMIFSIEKDINLLSAN